MELSICGAREMQSVKSEKRKILMRHVRVAVVAVCSRRGRHPRRHLQDQGIEKTHEENAGRLK